jgi:chemotaxis protein MotB
MIGVSGGFSRSKSSTRAILAGMALAAFSGCGIDKEVYQRDVQALRDEVGRLEGANGELTKARDKCLADFQELQAEKGAAVGSLQSNLQDALKQIEELRAVAARRQAMLDGIVASLQQMVAAGKIDVVQRNGRLIVQIAEAILFDVGKSKLKPEGVQALGELAPKLAAVGREFQVMGHTDNQGSAAVNWKLSLDRALSVLTTLTESGYPSERLSAAGVAFYQPVASNDTDQGRQSNRRVEIVLVPNLEELQLPKVSGTSRACEAYLASR